MDFEGLFGELRGVLLPYKRRLDCLHDEPGNLYLQTRFVMDNGKPLFFAAVQTRKRYVSYHLMPVYVRPQLLDELSTELRGRMHGKSCFNFRVVDTSLLDELAALTRSGYEYYQHAGYLS